MRFLELQSLPPDQFKRFCGVSPPTFELMLSALQTAVEQRPKPGGPSKLSLADQLLLALQYWREYRTYFHLAQDWGVHESTVCRTVHKIESILITSGAFSLPGKKHLLQPGTELEVVVVDVGEHPIERPQKSRDVSTVANTNATR